MGIDTQQEYCRVDVKTGEILDGPRTLPQNWGNVVGFKHLSAKDVRRYGWFPIDSATSIPGSYGLLFLPERGIILKVPNKGVVAGKTQYAMANAKQLAYRYAERDFASGVMGETMFFSNTFLDQAHRSNCLAAKMDCRCNARFVDNVYSYVTVPWQVLPRLIEDSVHAYDHVMMKLRDCLNGISTATDQQIAAMIDTAFVDYFDD